MDVSLAGSGITYRPNDDQLGGLSLEFAAFDGEVGVGQVPVPDPTAAISVYDGRALKVEEGSTLLTDGFIIDQDRERGPMPAGTARLHTLSVQDANALLDGFRLETTRPSETDVARVLARAAIDLPGVDTTWVVNANLATMPAKTYSSDGGWTSELIPDLVEFTGKTLWLHDKANGSGRCLHYHTLNSGHTCGLSISDQTSNGPTVWNPWNPRRQRTSVDLRNDIKVTDQAGRTSTVTDSTSITNHDADGLQHQALVNVEAGSQADLDIKAAALLASIKDERDTWTCAIGPLDETALLSIRVGDLITVTSSVMGLTASTQRIAHMTLHPYIGEGGRVVEGYWLADVELGAPVRRRARVRNVAYTDEPWVCIPQDLRVYWSTGVSGGTVILPTSSGSYHTALGGAVAHLYGGATYRVDYIVYHAPGSNNVAVAMRPTTGPATLLGAMAMGGQCPDGTTGGVYSNFATATITPGADLDYEPNIDTEFYLLCDSTASSVEAIVYYVSGSSDPRFYGLPACSNGEPRVGQLVKPSTFLGGGTTAAGTTQWPFQPGSLRVFVNGLDWTTDIATTDPDTGDYVMAYSFPLGATVSLLYRRAS